MRKFVIKFRGVDDFSRPVFKVVDSAIYFGRKKQKKWITKKYLRRTWNFG